MIEDSELNNILQSVAEKSLKFLANINKHSPTKIINILQQFFSLSLDVQSFLSMSFKSPQFVLDQQINYWRAAFNLSQNQLEEWQVGNLMPINDRRFSDQEWIKTPLFNFLSQHYLLAADHFKSFIQQIECQDQLLAKKVNFFTKQYLDALSPANFLLTNPQLMTETIQSNGKNLLCGLNNLLTDLEAGVTNWLIKFTTSKAFTVGKDIAITPGKVIFRNELIELIQYTPQTDKVYTIPLLIIPPWINKYYILDLSPHNSLINWLVHQGLTVFVISWINPDARYAAYGLYDYMQVGPISAIKVIQKQLKQNEVNVLGFCIGGTLTACMIAYLKALDLSPIKSATFLASLIDFSEPGEIGVFIDEGQIARLEEEMNAKGFLDGLFMATTFNLLRANDLVWSFFIKHYLQGKKRIPFDILFWNADATNMPATMHSQYLRWMYLHNNLIKPGKIILNNVPLDVSKIDIPTFFVSTQKDHIAPWETTYLGLQALTGDKQFLLGGSGHIAGIINPPHSQKYDFYYQGDTSKTATGWLKTAQQCSGSWWPTWFTWLAAQSGALIPVPARRKFTYKPLVDAPGTYVHININ